MDKLPEELIIYIYDINYNQNRKNVINELNYNQNRKNVINEFNKIINVMKEQEFDDEDEFGRWDIEFFLSFNNANKKNGDMWINNDSYEQDFEICNGKLKQIHLTVVYVSR